MSSYVLPFIFLSPYSLSHSTSLFTPYSLLFLTLYYVLFLTYPTVSSLSFSHPLIFPSLLPPSTPSPKLNFYQPSTIIYPPQPPTITTYNRLNHPPTYPSSSLHYRSGYKAYLHYSSHVQLTNSPLFFLLPSTTPRPPHVRLQGLPTQQVG